jgi:transketolase
MTASAAKQIRRVILEQAMRAHVGHIGSALSVADIIAALYDGLLRVNDPKDPERDRFVLGKGHAMLAVYAAFFLKGWLTKEDLNTYCGDGTMLGVHPEYGLRGVDFASGSLGQGLSVAAGAALAARLQRSPRRAFALLSDAECNEGSVWEAIMFAAHHKLANLIAIVDLNGQQALGYTDQVMSLRPLAERWRAFGWDVHEVDGHDVAAMQGTVTALNTTVGPPHVLIARTTFGKGVSYMEGKIKWHYWPMSDAEYRQAVQEVEARP